MPKLHCSVCRCVSNHRHAEFFLFIFLWLHSHFLSVYRVKFYTAVNLAAELAEAVQMNRFSILEKSLGKIDLLIIDELSYLTFNRYQSEMLFQIISERSERASVIISTNLEFSEWTQLFENEMMLAALIDRVTFRSFVLNMNCSSSYRIDSTIKNY